MGALDAYIDILVKLIIAFIGINAPLVSYLLTNFSKHIGDIKRINDEKKITISQDHLNEVAEQGEDQEKLAKESNEKLKKIEKQEAEDLRYIEPKNNIAVIFSFLFSSLAFLLIYVFTKTLDCSCGCDRNNYIFSCLLILLSTLLFICAVRRIYKVVWAFIDTKKIIDDYYKGKDEIEQVKK